MADVAIVDFGAQYGHLIERVVGRDLGYDYDVMEPDEYDPEQYQATILTGGPDSVTADDYRGAHLDFDDGHPPTLGICYGHQLLVHKLGGDVIDGTPQYGVDAEITVEERDPLFAHQTVGETFEAVMSHGDTVTALPDAVTETATAREKYRDDADEITAAFVSDCGTYRGVQFHPETYETEDGTEIFRNFLHDVAGLSAD